MITFSSLLIPVFVVMLAGICKSVWHLGKLSGLDVGWEAYNKSIAAWKGAYEKSIEDYNGLRERVIRSDASWEALLREQTDRYNQLVTRVNGSNSLPPMTSKPKTTKSN